MRRPLVYCSKNGKKYELQIYNILVRCQLNGIYFNTQKESDLGGCDSNKCDIICNMNNENNICIEIKKSKTPDWMQCSLKYDDINKKWTGTTKNKIPDKSKVIFLDLLSNVQLFNNKIPPFIYKNITHSQWLKIKTENKDFDDMYIDCPSDTIKRLYSEKNCKYIQISDKGLYHLGDVP